jgi:Lrp/AsnC ligand binding domain
VTDIRRGPRWSLVKVADTKALDQLVLGKITDAPGVQATETHVVLAFIGSAEPKTLLWRITK